MDVYLLPGLGADHRLFQRLDLTPHHVHALDWSPMPEGSGLRDYALALAGRVDASQPHALIGVSMGGMVAQELASITKPALTIIISSWKGPHEMPVPMKLLRGTHAEKLLTPAFIKHGLPIMRWQMGLETAEDTALFDAFIASTPLAQVRVQIAAVLGWEGPAQPVPRLTHIHGDQDRLMPIAHIKHAQVIKGGGHFMVFNRAEQVCASIRVLLAGA